MCCWNHDYIFDLNQFIFEKNINTLNEIKKRFFETIKTKH